MIKDDELHKVMESCIDVTLADVVKQSLDTSELLRNIAMNSIETYINGNVDVFITDGIDEFKISLIVGQTDKSNNHTEIKYIYIDEDNEKHLKWFNEAKRRHTDKASIKGKLENYFMAVFSLSENYLDSWLLLHKYYKDLLGKTVFSKVLKIFEDSGLKEATVTQKQIEEFQEAFKSYASIPDYMKLSNLLSS